MKQLSHSLSILFLILGGHASAKTPYAVKFELGDDPKCLSVAKMAFKKGFDREFHEYVLKKDPSKSTVDWSQFDFSDVTQSQQALRVYNAIHDYFNAVVNKIKRIQKRPHDDLFIVQHKFTLFINELNICYFAARDARRTPSRK